MSNYLELSSLGLNKQGLNYEINDFQMPNKSNEYNSLEQSLFTNILDENNSSSDFEIHECGAELIPWAADFFGGINDYFDGESKDGEIGDTQQGATGDCWLLSGVNALSYTEEGRKIIKDSLEYHNGYTIVHTMAGDYVVTDDEITRTKGSFQYSDGDDDMIIFELAIEKVIDDYLTGTIDLNNNAPDALESLLREEDGKTRPGHSSTNGGNIRGLIYLLSGKMGYSEANKEKINDVLEQFKKNGKNLALGAATNDGDRNATDINGKKVKLSGNHGYSIKKYDGQNVTVINPWDSSKEIILSKEEFLKVFDRIDVCDISSNNPTKEYIDTKAFYNSQGLLEKTVERVDEENLTRTISYTYDNDGNLTGTKSSFQYDSGLFGEIVYDKNFSAVSRKTGNKNTDVLLTYEYDQNGNACNYQFGGINANGDLRYTFAEMTDEIGRKIAENYQLMTYQNLSAQDIFKLAKDLDNTQFNKALDYLKQNPNATYNDVKNNI